MALTKISGDLIVLDSITANQVAANVVTTEELSNDAVQANNILNGAITSDKLASGAVTGDKLGITSINANNIVDSSITTDKLSSSITLANSFFSDSSSFLGRVLEKANITTTLGSTTTVNISSPVVVFTANSTSNSTINFTGLSDISVGNVSTFVIMVPNGTDAKYINSYQIDGSSVTPKWSGGAPVGGTSANTDIYSFSIVKTAADPIYNVFAQVSSFF